MRCPVSKPDLRRHSLTPARPSARPPACPAEFLSFNNPPSSYSPRPSPPLPFSLACSLKRRLRPAAGGAMQQLQRPGGAIGGGVNATAGAGPRPGVGVGGMGGPMGDPAFTRGMQPAFAIHRRRVPEHSAVAGVDGDTGVKSKVAGGEALPELGDASGVGDRGGVGRGHDEATMETGVKGGAKGGTGFNSGGGGRGVVEHNTTLRPRARAGRGGSASAAMLSYAGVAQDSRAQAPIPNGGAYGGASLAGDTAVSYARATGGATVYDQAGGHNGSDFGGCLVPNGSNVLCPKPKPRPRPNET